MKTYDELKYDSLWAKDPEQITEDEKSFARSYLKKQYLEEINLSRIHTYLENYSFGFITAYRSKDAPERISKKLSDAENLQLNKKLNVDLRSDIRSAGYSYVVLRGFFQELDSNGNPISVKEESFLITAKRKGDDGGELKGFLKKLGQKYHQDSVFYKDYSNDVATLIGTNTSTGVGSTNPVGFWHPQKLGYFYSQLRNGKTFTFESVFCVKEPGNINTRALLKRKFDFTLESVYSD